MKLHIPQPEIPDRQCDRICDILAVAGHIQDWIIVICGVLTICIVGCYRRRNEFFFIFTPLCFTISSLVAIIHHDTGWSAPLVGHSFDAVS